jgi:hypothetical protein
MVMARITKADMDRTKSNRAPPLLHVDHSELYSPAGEYDDPPGPIEGDPGEIRRRAGGT